MSEHTAGEFVYRLGGPHDESELARLNQFARRLPIGYNPMAVQKCTA